MLKGLDGFPEITVVERKKKQILALILVVRLEKKFFPDSIQISYTPKIHQDLLCY